MKLLLFAGLTALASLIAAAAVSAQGPIELEILDPRPRAQDSNFRLANITGFSVSYVVPEEYRLFGTTNTQRIRWNSAFTGLQDMYHATLLCSRTANPLFWDRRCLDAIGLFRKYVDCGAGSTVDLTPISIGANGLEFAFTQDRDNLPSSPRLIADQLDFWIIQNQETPSAPGDWTRRLTASRKTARITGGIFGP